MWKCKDCSLSFSERSELLKHYRIDHRFHDIQDVFDASLHFIGCLGITIYIHLPSTHPGGIEAAFWTLTPRHTLISQYGKSHTTPHLVE
ncbi:unnamed protein product [Gadus morhua 'NCC']